MGLPVAAILKSLPTIMTATSAIVSSLKSRRDAPGVVSDEEEIKRLEDDLLKTNKLLGELTRQVEALAAALRQHAEAAERRRKLLLATAAAAGVAIIISLIALSLKL